MGPGCGHFSPWGRWDLLGCPGAGRPCAAGASTVPFLVWHSPGFLPPHLVLCFPPAQRHFHLQRHPQQHCSLGLRGNSLPLTNLSAAALRREGEGPSGASLPAGGLGSPALLCCFTCLPCQAPGAHRLLLGPSPNWAAAWLVGCLWGQHSLGEKEGGQHSGRLPLAQISGRCLCQA